MQIRTRSKGCGGGNQIFTPTKDRKFKFNSGKKEQKVSSARKIEFTFSFLYHHAAPLAFLLVGCFSPFSLR
jgi:hypothetical protein